jgi:hypothetical protein
MKGLMMTQSCGIPLGSRNLLEETSIIIVLVAASSSIKR